MRVNVYQEGSEDRPIWYKERFLGDNEIIEQLVLNQTSQVCWIIHRPFRGWYIRLRAPMFPSGIFIPLTPVPRASPYHVDGSLTFSSRTNPTPLPNGTPDPPQRSLTLQDDSSQASIHSYPPTPPATHLCPPSANSISSKKEATGAQSQVTQFILAPLATSSPRSPTHQQQSLFSRALSMLKSHSPSNSNSFTLSRVPLNTPLSPPPPYVLNLPAADASRSTLISMNSPPDPSVGSALTVAPLHTPLLTFHDQTPVLTVRSLTGLLEMDKSEEVLLGVDTSFWVAVALTYLEFLEEREVCSLYRGTNLIFILT
ncbi:hypothetical protein AN958_04266 [Leucoagaricus sp. SymC.cos]|nr:hypothetical protein AN958_04266 [Leucoagaricus sp. SymC.cos]